MCEHQRHPRVLHDERRARRNGGHRARELEPLGVEVAAAGGGVVGPAVVDAHVIAHALRVEAVRGRARLQHLGKRRLLALEAL